MNNGFFKMWITLIFEGRGNEVIQALLACKTESQYEFLNWLNLHPLILDKSVLDKFELDLSKAKRKLFKDIEEAQIRS